MTIPSELRAITLPDPDAQRRYLDLVGIDDIKSDLLLAMRAALNPKSLKDWAKKYDGHDAFVALLLDRPQLFVLGGDVGTGKTELAETIGDELARRESASVTLFSISLAARGSGFVGEMTQRIVAAFDYVRSWGSKRGMSNGKRCAGILFIDEADAIAQSRAELQMHHEDRAGVNALIRSIDDLRRAGVPVATIIATNRLDALDPAVRRRAARVFEFNRPNPEQRRQVFAKVLPGATPDEIARLVDATGATDGRLYGYTYSDIVQRLIPAAALRSYAARAPVSAQGVLEEADRVHPTPPFNGAV